MNRPRRILYVVNHAGFFISHRLPLAIAARDAGYEVHIATPRSKHVPQLQAAGFTWHVLPLVRSAVNPLNEIRSFFAIYRLYRRLNPDLVHHVTSKPVLYGSIAARLAGVHAVVNAIPGVGYAFGKGGLLRRLLRTIIRRAYRVALKQRNGRVIFQNREQLEEFVHDGRVKASDAVLIAGSGVDVSQFVPVERRDHSPLTVVLASRMLTSKGVKEFVEAARLLRNRGIDARFQLVGEPDPDNPESIPIETLRRWDSEGIVSYAGRREDMPVVLADCDVFVLPTYYGEGLPKVLVEAAASGLPIVTTDWPGCRDVVTDRVNGLLVPIRDVQSLAHAIQQLLTDKPSRDAMGKRGRERAVERFALSGVVAETLAVYRELLA